MKDVCQLITDGERKIVVLSAMSGTTNSLVEIADYIKKKNLEGAGSVINKLRTLYRTHVSELYSKQENVEHTDNLLNDISCICTTLQPSLIVQLSKRRFWHKAN